MKRNRNNKVFRLMHVALLCIGLLASDVRAALDVGAAARQTGDGPAGGESSIRSAGANELPMAAIRPSNGAEFAPLPNNKLPQDATAFEDAGLVAAPAGVHAGQSKLDTEFSSPSTHSLVMRHVRLQI